MNTEPGGESTQYESIKTQTVPTAKEQGQFGGATSDTGASSVSQERGQKTSENVRYGQNISESGMGGMTTTSGGSAGQDGYGGTAKQKDSEEDKGTRSQQSYGAGSGVGA